MNAIFTNSILLLLFFLIELYDSSLITNFYFTKDKFQIDNINSVLKIKDNLYIHSSEGVLYRCNYINLLNMNCTSYITTNNEKIFSFNFNNQLIILNNDEISLSDVSSSSLKPNVTFTHPFNSIHKINSALFTNDNNLVLSLNYTQSNQTSFNTLKFPVYEDIHTMNAYKPWYVFSTLQVSNGMLVSSGPDPDGSIKVWDPNENYNLKIQQRESSYEKSLLELSNGMIASGNYGSGSVQIWDPNLNFTKVADSKWQYITNIDSLIEPSKGYIVSSHSGYLLKLWSYNKTGSISLNLEAETREKSSWLSKSKLIKLSEGTIAVGSMNGTINIYNTISYNNFSLVTALNGHHNQVNVLLNLFNNRMASADSDGFINIWGWDTNMNFTQIKKLEGSSVEISELLQLSNGWLVSSDINGNIKVFNCTENYFENLYTIQAHSNIITSLTELSDGRLISQDKLYNKVWDPRENFALVGTISNEFGGPLKIIQLSNGNIITPGENGTLKVFDFNNINSFESNHTLDNMIEINKEYLISYKNNTLCKYNKVNHFELNSCIQVNSEITYVSKINETSFVSSQKNGIMVIYDLQDFKPILSKNITEFILLESYVSDYQVYIQKIIKFETGELILFLNSNTVLILNEFSLNLIHSLEDHSDSFNSTFIDIFTNPEEFNKFYGIYSNGIMKSFGYNSKLFLNNLIFSDTIQLSSALHPIDQNNQNKIKIDHIPKCLMIYDDNNKILDGYIIHQNHKLKYELNGVCDKDDNLLFSTNYPYLISIYPRDPPSYPLKEISANTTGVELFKDFKLNEDIRKIIFQPIKFGKIVYINNSTTFQVEYFKEYDKNLEFRIIFDFYLEESIGIYVPFILKDLYDITSEVINLKINIIRTVPWYKKWYSIVLMLFAVLAGIYKFIKWIKSGKLSKIWKQFKSGINKCCECYKYKFLCCFKKEEKLLDPENEKII